MLTLAQEVTHPWSLNWALAHASWFYQFRREGRVVQKQAEAALALASEYGFPYWAAEGNILRGWAMVEREQAEEGITQIQQGLTAYRDIEGELAQTYFLALLVEAYGKMGEIEKGFSALTEALATVDKTGERYYEAELYRLKGELTLQAAGRSLQSAVTNSQSLISTPQVEAEACFLKAIAIARQQRAKSLELRAVMSLARLWQQQGRKDEARQMLAEIYGWFTEEFDTKDLQEAKALLDELAEAL